MSNHALTSKQQYHELRSRTIKALRESRNPDPYPHKFHVSQSVPSFIQQWSEDGKVAKEVRVETEEVG